MPHRLLDIADGEVRPSDMTRKSGSLDLAQCFQCLGERNPGVRPMQQQEIDLE
jgi:hypothetical protein